jgi:hypothetical protein
MPPVPAAAVSTAAQSGVKSAKGGARPAKGGRADRSAPATAGDVGRLRRQAAQGDALLQSAYEAGQDATPFEELVVDVREAPGAREAYEAGRAENRSAGRSSAADTARSAAGSVAGVRGPGLVNDGAGFVLGLILYALVLNYVQGGPSQARGWIAAKFLNRPFSKDLKTVDGKLPKGIVKVPKQVPK